MVMGSPLRIFHGNPSPAAAAPPGSPPPRRHDEDAAPSSPPLHRRILSLARKSVSRSSSSSSAAAAAAAASRPRSFSITLMEENLELAEPIISRLGFSAANADAEPPLFAADPSAAQTLLRAVSDVHQAVLFFSSSSDDEVDPTARSGGLARAQTLMDSGIRRLHHDFRRLLAALPAGATAIEGDAVTGYLRDIAELMISSGSHGKECIRAYKSARQTVIATELDRLELHRPSTNSNTHKLDWAVLEPKIVNWLSAFPAAVTTLFAGEHALCGRIFHDDVAVRDACFAGAAGDAAAGVVSFPESVARSRRSPEKLFRLLDLHAAVSSHFDAITVVFAAPPAAGVRAQALSSLLKLAEAARGTIGDLEAAIQRDPSGAGAGVHPISRYVLNYTVFLADYEPILEEIVADFPVDPMPGTAGSGGWDEVSVRFGRVLEVLRRKIAGKARSCRDAAAGDLFMASNLEYAAAKVRSSRRLSEVLGEEWIRDLEDAAREHATRCERRRWIRVSAAIPAAVTTEKEAREGVLGFRSAFDEACCRRRDEDSSSSSSMAAAAMTRMIVSPYRQFYWRCRGLLADGSPARAALLSPEEVRSKMAEAFAVAAALEYSIAEQQSSSSSSCRKNSITGSTQNLEYYIDD